MSPVHEFKCPQHGDFERRLSFKDEVPVQVECPGCGKPSVRVQHVPGVSVSGGTTPPRPPGRRKSDG